MDDRIGSRTGCKDYYEVLGVGRTADDRTIKSAYRRLALKYHPDVAQCTRAADRFRGIHEAYEVLADPKQRARYDLLWAATSRGTSRSYSFGFCGLGIRLDFGWRA